VNGFFSAAARQSYKNFKDFSRFPGVSLVSQFPNVEGDRSQNTGICKFIPIVKLNSKT
jgi:hypothetical protein